MKDLEDKDRWMYTDLIDSMGIEVLRKGEDGDYHGDDFYLIQDSSRYGYLGFGCSLLGGCDALDNCRTTAQATELRDQLWRSIHWENSATDMFAYLVTRDWGPAHDGSGFKDFLNAAKVRLISDVICELVAE